jgi:hypothetical protein
MQSFPESKSSVGGPYSGAVSRRNLVNLLASLVLVGATIVCVVIRVRTLNLPLERDEGEYAYCAQLTLEGVPPYQLAYTMKFPGVSGTYALFMALFGQTRIAIHLGLLLLVLATAVGLMLLGRKLFDWPSGCIAAATYLVLVTSPSVLGLAAHATHFVVLPIVVGTLILASGASLTSRRIFSAGLLFGIAGLMKQPAYAFVGLGVAMLAERSQAWRNFRVGFLWFAGATLLPLALICGLLWYVGTFSQFWFWTVSYLRQYGSLISPSVGLHVFWKNWREAMDLYWPIWAVAGLGAALIAAGARHRLFFAALAVTSLAALGSGFYFRPHYFILLLPLLSLLVGAVIAASRLVRESFRWIIVIAITLVLASPVIRSSRMLFSVDLDEFCHLQYGSAPFPEAVRIGKFIRERSTPEDRVAIMGSEPEILFYAHRRSATPYMYLYPATEPTPLHQRWQGEIRSAIEQTQPRFFIIVGDDPSWSQIVQSDHIGLQNWAVDYAHRHYKLIGVTNMVSPRETDYFLPVPDPNFKVSTFFVAVYER